MQEHKLVTGIQNKQKETNLSDRGMKNDSLRACCEKVKIP